MTAKRIAGAGVTTLMLAALCAPVHATLKIVITDQITGDGINANVYLVKPGPPELDTPFGTTDQDGVVEDANATCESRLIRVDPLDNDYPPPTTMRICSGAEVHIAMRSRSTNRQIRQVALRAEASGKHGLAAQALSEVTRPVPTSKQRRPC